MAKYRTKKGDTLRSLSKKYGVKRKKLRKLNPDMKFGKAKSKGGKGFKKFDKDTVLKLGKGVGQPFWKSEVLQDPTYAAFDRNFEYNRSKVHDEFLALKDKLARDLVRQDARYDQQRVEGTRGVNRSMDNRGLYRSGQRHMGLGRMNNKIDFEREQYVSGQGEVREEGRRKKQEAIGDLKRQRAEERLGARSRLTARDAETKYGI